MITKMMTFKNEFKIESRTLQGSRGNLISRIKNQDSRFKNDQDSRFKNNQDQDSRIIKIKIQDSKIQESREDLIKISIKKFFKTLSSTRSFHKIITKEFYSLVIDYQIIVGTGCCRTSIKTLVCLSPSSLLF